MNGGSIDLEMSLSDIREDVEVSVVLPITTDDGNLSFRFSFVASWHGFASWHGSASLDIAGRFFSSLPKRNDCSGPISSVKALDWLLFMVASSSMTGSLQSLFEE